MASTRRPYRYYDLIMAFFVAVLLISNIASSAKMVDWGISFFGLRLTFDAGTILFPLSYIFGDILTEVYGYRRSRRIIWIGFACNVLMAVTLIVVGLLPSQEEWRSGLAVTMGQETGGADLAYRYLLSDFRGGAWRIVVASLIAYFAGEFSNSYILARMKVWTRGRWLWTRTIGSTLVGEGVDTVLFVLIAFAGAAGQTGDSLGRLILTNYLFKVGVETVMTPITYRVVGALKRAEQEDYYDVDTDFNPFRLQEGSEASPQRTANP